MSDSRGNMNQRLDEAQVVAGAGDVGADAVQKGHLGEAEAMFAEALGNSEVVSRRCL